MGIRSCALVLVLVTLGCGSGSPSGTGGAGTGGGDAGAPRCDVHATSGTPHFTDRTAEWGLAATPVLGVAQVMSAADLDGDGYPDLIVSSYQGNNEREVIGGEKHFYRVLMNVPRPGGGRMFVDRTQESGYGQTRDGSTTEYRRAIMAIYADVDNDGDLDIFSGTYTELAQIKSPPTPGDLDRSEILLNDGTGHFTLGPPSAVETKAAQPLGGGAFVDADRDGHIDLFLGNWYGLSGYQPQKLLEGGGEPGAFTDVSLDAGIKVSKNYCPAFGITACDLDDDGTPELLVSCYGRRPNLLYKSDGPLHYQEIGVASKFAYDDQQSYADDQFFLCWCQLNATDPACAGAAMPQVQCPSAAQIGQYWDPVNSVKPENLGGNTFTTACSDITGDGKLDLYNGEIRHWWAGQASDGSQLLVNVSNEQGISFSRPGNDATGMTWPHPSVDWDEGGLYAAAADMDNDGREDVIVGATDYNEQWGMFFHQKPDGTFAEIAKESGFVKACASAPIVADFDRDGDLDIVVGTSLYNSFCPAQFPNGTELRFFESDAGTLGRWLAIRLRGDGLTTNTTGIGARVKVTTVGEDGKEVTQVKELSGGYGHYGMQHDTVLFFGMGGCTAAARVEVQWPNAMRTKDTWEVVQANRVIELRQADPKVYEAMVK